MITRIWKFWYLILEHSFTWNSFIVDWVECEIQLHFSFSCSFFLLESDFVLKSSCFRLCFVLKFWPTSVINSWKNCVSGRTFKGIWLLKSLWNFRFSFQIDFLLLCKIFSKSCFGSNFLNSTCLSNNSCQRFNRFLLTHLVSVEYVLIVQVSFFVGSCYLSAEVLKCNFLAFELRTLVDDDWVWTNSLFLSWLLLRRSDVIVDRIFFLSFLND